MKVKVLNSWDRKNSIARVRFQKGKEQSDVPFETFSLKLEDREFLFEDGWLSVGKLPAGECEGEIIENAKGKRQKAKIIPNNQLPITNNQTNSKFQTPNSKQDEVAASFSLREKGIKIKVGANKANFLLDDKEFFTYNWEPTAPKPYLFPLYGPEGQIVIAPSSSDHPHHRGIFFAHGDMNGLDFWNESSISRQIAVKEVWEGIFSAKLVTINEWYDKEKKVLIKDEREIKAYLTPQDGRYIDLKIKYYVEEDERLTPMESSRLNSQELIRKDFKMRRGNRKVIFGPTKEAGPLGLRVHADMEGEVGGIILNTYGAKREELNWGRKSHWCDYSGKVSGYDWAGITVFDNPSNPMYPTTWHVRDYGLFAANCFYFNNYTHTVDSENPLVLNYRIYIHKDKGENIDISSRFLDYIEFIKINL